MLVAVPAHRARTTRPPFELDDRAHLREGIEFMRCHRQVGALRLNSASSKRGRYALVVGDSAGAIYLAQDVAEIRVLGLRA